MWCCTHTHTCTRLVCAARLRIHWRSPHASHCQGKSLTPAALCQSQLCQPLMGIKERWGCLSVCRSIWRNKKKANTSVKPCLVLWSIFLERFTRNWHRHLKPRTQWGGRISTLQNSRDIISFDRILFGQRWHPHKLAAFSRHRRLQMAKVNYFPFLLLK